MKPLITPDLHHEDNTLKLTNENLQSRGRSFLPLPIDVDINIDDTVFEEENDVSVGEESDVSDVYEDEDLGNDGNISNWLEEEDEVLNSADSSTATTPSIEIPNSPYIQANKTLYLALIEVEDLNFENQPMAKQEELMQSLVIEKYEPNAIIFEEGSSSLDMYFIISSEDRSYEPEVEVVKKMDDGSEKVLTRLMKGQYFGQKYFLVKRMRQRSATIRIPSDSLSAVEVARLPPEHFDLWIFYRTTLLIKAVPLIQMLPNEECSEIIDKMQIKEFGPGDYIIRQGERGDEFFIIREGSVKIIDENRGGKLLTTLKESHFFGEMALVTDEPRVASVVALEATICLSLAKAAFMSALSATTFHNVLSQVLEQRQALREQRSRVAEAKREKIEEMSGFSSPNRVPSGSSSARTQSSSSGSKPKGYSRHPSRYSLTDLGSPSPTTSSALNTEDNSSVASHNTNDSEVTVTSKVTMKKLSSGSRLINKYLVLKELGKGSFGEVFLCQDEETGSKYAMKVINRNSNSSNDDITTSIRREIAVMKRLRHENVVSLHEVIDDPSARKIFLIQEFMEGGPLLPDDEKVDPIPEKQCRIYFRDILCGVSYLHAEGIIHRDIKPSNMLLTADKRVKIADFGAAVFSSAYEKAAAGGTPAFMSPELCVPNSNIDVTKLPAIDVFALGATLYCMVVGHPPWMASNAIELATKIKNIELTFPDESLDPHLKHLLKRMLDKDYHTRMTLDQIIMDDWVTTEGSDPLFNDDFEVDDEAEKDFIHYSNELDGQELLSRLRSVSEREVMITGERDSISSLSDILVADDDNTGKTIITSHLSPSTLSLLNPSLLHPKASHRLSTSHHHHSHMSPSSTMPTIAPPIDDPNPQPRVLIIIDHPIIRKVLISHLKELAVKCYACDSGSSALADEIRSSIQRSKLYDFILYDYDASSLKDKDIIKEIRAIGYIGRLVVMTDTPELCHDFKALGVDYILSKPVQPGQLKKMITQGLAVEGRYDDITKAIFDLDVDDAIICVTSPVHLPSSPTPVSPTPVTAGAAALNSQAPICSPPRPAKRGNGIVIPPLPLKSPKEQDIVQVNATQTDGIAEVYGSRRGIMVPPILSMMTPEGTPRDSNDPVSPPGTLLSNQSGSGNNLFEDYPKPNLTKIDSIRESKRLSLDRIREQHHPESTRHRHHDHDNHATTPSPIDESTTERRKRLTRTQEFIMVPSDMVLNADGTRGIKSIAIVGSRYDLIHETTKFDREDNARRRMLREAAIRRSKKQHQKAPSSTSPTNASPLNSTQSKHQQIITNFTPKSTISSHVPYFFNSDWKDHDTSSSSSTAHPGLDMHLNITASISSVDNHTSSAPASARVTVLSPEKRASLPSPFQSLRKSSTKVSMFQLSSSGMNETSPINTSSKRQDFHDISLDNSPLSSSSPSVASSRPTSTRHRRKAGKPPKQSFIDVSIPSPPRSPFNKPRDSRRISISSSCRMSTAVSSSDDSSDDELIYMDDAGIDALIQTPKSNTGSTTHDDDGMEWDRSYLSEEDMRCILAADDCGNDMVGIRFGVSGLCGDRPYMEDRAYGIHEVLGKDHDDDDNQDDDDDVDNEDHDAGYVDSEYESMSFLAVFDGHNGDYVADVLQQSFHEHLIHHLINTPSSSSSDDTHESRISQALRITCHDMDMQILYNDYLRQLEHQRKGTLFAQKYAGAVGVMLVIYRSIASPATVHCALANVGDCRAVLCDNQGVAHALTMDHKPYLIEEKTRIEESGGFVNKNRVNGILAVSRSFGDLPYKLSSTSDDSKEELHLQRQVISEPQIIEFVVESQHQFIIMASDGIWEVMENQAAVDYVRKQLAIHRDVDIAASKLTQKALTEGSMDNISAVVVMMNQTS